MKKHIIGENRIHYTLGKDGFYYPDLKFSEEADYPIGKYGRMRAEYVKVHRHAMYLELIYAGKWNAYLHEVDEECYQRMEVLVEQMKAGAGITEELKAENQMLWVRMLNNIRHSVEEVVLEEIVYG